MSAITVDYSKRRELALGLMGAGAVHYDEKGRNPFRFNFRAPRQRGRMTERLAVLAADCIWSAVCTTGRKFDAVVSLQEGVVVADVLSRRLARQNNMIPRGCVVLREQTVRGKRAISGVKGVLPEGGKDVLLMSGFTTKAKLEQQAVKLLSGEYGLDVPVAVVLVNQGGTAMKDLYDSTGCTLHSVFELEDFFGSHAETDREHGFLRAIA